MCTRKIIDSTSPSFLFSAIRVRFARESTTSSDNSSTKFVRTLTLTLTWIFWYTLVMEVKLKTDTCTRVKGTDIVEYHIRFLFICNSFQDTVGKGGSGQDSIDHSSSHFVRDPQYLAPWPRRRVLSPLTNCRVSNNKKYKNKKNIWYLQLRSAN